MKKHITYLNIYYSTMFTYIMQKNNVFTYPPSINISDESYIKKIIMNNNVNGRQTEWQSFLHHKFLKSSKLLNSAFLTTNNKLENY